LAPAKTMKENPKFFQAKKSYLEDRVSGGVKGKRGGSVAENKSMVLGQGSKAKRKLCRKNQLESNRTMDFHSSYCQSYGNNVGNLLGKPGQGYNEKKLANWVNQNNISSRQKGGSQGGYLPDNCNVSKNETLNATNGQNHHEVVSIKGIFSEI
jgi:hypothetical protein